MCFFFFRMNEMGLSPTENKVYFGQLLGMCDQISFPLGMFCSALLLKVNSKLWNHAGLMSHDLAIGVLLKLCPYRLQLFNTQGATDLKKTSIGLIFKYLVSEELQFQYPLLLFFLVSLKLNITTQTCLAKYFFKFHVFLWGERWCHNQTRTFL